MHVIYARQSFPEKLIKSIFLAGPSPRNTITPSWRLEFVAELERQGYDGVVFSPESDPDSKLVFDYDDQVEWEQHCRQMADVVVFWIPRQLPSMPALVTNIEFGEDLSSGRVLYGRPAWAERCKYLDKIYAQQNKKPAESIPTLVGLVLKVLGDGSERVGGETRIPLQIWRTKQFQAWYATQKSVGNILEDAKTLWNFRVGSNSDIIFAYALWVKIWIAAEKRHKQNEFLISRPDIVAIVPIWRGPTPSDSKVVLIREFRSPVRNGAVFVYELPGGSSPKPNEDPLEVASHELEEEAGLSIEPTRFKFLGSRQIVATLSTHQAQVFQVSLSNEELSYAQRIADSGQSFGIDVESEKTYLEIKTINQILADRLLDWSMLGMIFQALTESG